MTLRKLYALGIDTKNCNTISTKIVNCKILCIEWVIESKRFIDFCHLLNVNSDSDCGISNWICICPIAKPDPFTHNVKYFHFSINFKNVKTKKVRKFYVKLNSPHSNYCITVNLCDDSIC